jgi:protein SCO1/2
MTGWLRHPLLAPVLAVIALGWGALVVTFLVVGPHAGPWATTLLTSCFGWSPLTRGYRLDTVLLVTLEPPLFVLVVGLFFGPELRAFLATARGRVAGGAVAAMFAVAVVTLLATGRVLGGAAPAAATPVREVRPVPRAALVDHRGQGLSLGGPLARPTALTFIYADCHASCPLLVERLRAAAATVGDRAAFVAVTLAPERDTPAALAAYAERWQLPEAFRLATGAPAVLEELRAAVGVRAERRPDGEIGHDNVIVLLDGRGRIAFTLRGLAAGADLPALLLALAAER